MLVDVHGGVVDDVLGDDDAVVLAGPARHLGVLPADEVGQFDDADDVVPLRT